MATIIPGISPYAFIALLILHTAANTSFSASILWADMTKPDIITPGGGETAAQQGLIHCHTCSLLVSEPRPGRDSICPRCASPLHQRKTHSLDALATIRPCIGAVFFAGMVVTTILAARSFDPRLIWDHYGRA